MPVEPEKVGRRLVGSAPAAIQLQTQEPAQVVSHQRWPACRPRDDDRGHVSDARLPVVRLRRAEEGAVVPVG
jgi:hypothetical protein